MILPGPPPQPLSLNLHDLKEMLPLSSHKSTNFSGKRGAGVLSLPKTLPNFRMTQKERGAWAVRKTGFSVKALCWLFL